MIRSIEIQRFRCFARLRIEECRRINVIVGDNGAGKTALLEAIFLALGTTTELGQRYRQQRGLPVALAGSARRIEEAVWRDYFFNRDWHRPLEIKLRGDGPEARSVCIEYGSSSVSISPSEPQRETLSPPLKVQWQDSDGAWHVASPVVAQGRIDFPSTDEDLPNFFYFAANQTIQAGEAAERFSDLNRAGHLDLVVEALREEYPWIADMSLDVSAGAPVISVVTHDGQRRPLPNVSGALNRILGIFLTVASRDRSVVLVDEIENGVYYKHQGSVIRSLFHLSKKFNSQLFVTTHSQEWLLALAAVVDDPSEISLWRVERSKNGPIVRQFGGPTFVAGIETGGEVR